MHLCFFYKTMSMIYLHKFITLNLVKRFDLHKQNVNYYLYPHRLQYLME